MSSARLSRLSCRESCEGTYLPGIERKGVFCVPVSLVCVLLALDRVGSFPNSRGGANPGPRQTTPPGAPGGVSFWGTLAPNQAVHSL
jgi:hypothetical protein